MNKKNLAIALASFVFLAACDAGNNSHVRLKNYGDTDITTNKRKIARRNYRRNYPKNYSYKERNYVASSCKEFMQYEMNIPLNSQWSSVEDLIETGDGWEWRGWVDVYGERNSFVCNINGNKITASTHLDESYPDTFYDHKYDYKRNHGSIANSCKDFMEYEMEIPRNSQWSSVDGIIKTYDGWQWQGWVDVYGERNKFLCTVNPNGVNVVTNFQDSYNYEYEYTY
ncbi:MAG: hypothetical protein QNJ68_07765 [Microcoleaceae cyanobacterium MO_207.B10]|nr:hypothetical protein [Microcoleaceae cyanobacterium MO_207.B10]